MPIIHIQVNYNSEILKDWKGLPVKKEIKIKDFFEDISILYLSSNWWKTDFEVRFSPSKALVGKKISVQCIAQKSVCQYRIYAHFYLISQEIIESNRIPIINAFDILRVSSNDLFISEFNDFPRNILKKLRIDLSNWIKNNGSG